MSSNEQLAAELQLRDIAHSLEIRRPAKLLEYPIELVVVSTASH